MPPHCMCVMAAGMPWREMITTEGGEPKEGFTLQPEWHERAKMRSVVYSP